MGRLVYKGEFQEEKITIFVEATPSSRHSRSHLVLACFRVAESCSEVHPVEFGAVVVLPRPAKVSASQTQLHLRPTHKKARRYAGPLKDFVIRFY